LDLDPHRTRGGSRDFTLDNLKRAFRTSDLGDAHFCHGILLSAVTRDLMVPQDASFKMAHSFLRSMLPPETTQTILPVPALPDMAQATGQPPAPSAMTRFRSASKRTVAATSDSWATRTPSINFRARSSICGNTVLLPMPSTNDG